MSVVDVLGASSGAPDQIALLSPDGAMTYEALDRAVAARAEDIAAARAGELVATGASVPLVVDGARADTVIDVLACWKAGLVPVPLNARLTAPEIDRAHAVLDRAPLPAGSQVVLWTSGTSGQPRGVALSFDNLRAITDASAARLDLGSHDVWVASLSPAHVGGLVLVVRALLLGSTLIAAGAPDTGSLARLLEDGFDAGGDVHLPTQLSLVPVQLQRLLDHVGDRAAPASLRCVLIGGAHAPGPLVERAVASGWPIALTYGCTEMSSQIATAPPALVREFGSTVGAPLQGVEVRVADDGELLVRGPTRALGYVGAESDTDGGGPAEVESPPPLADAEGWYHTGDLGSVDDDGHLRITGRRIDRIVSGGVTIDAVEVEEAVRAHPSVVDVCVVGVPDETWGERVAALVIPVEGEYDPETLEGHLRDHLMAAKVPRAWQLAVDLPRNPNGKVDRPAVRALLSGSRSTPPS